MAACRAYIQAMRYAFAFALLLPAAAFAQAAEEDAPTLMERGLQQFFEGLLDEMEPTLDDFQSFAEGLGPAMREMMQEMGPAFAELLEQVDDITNYEAPEILPNGDIILRRREDAPAYEPPPPLPDGPKTGVDL